jgi:hypothetical protein
MLILSCTTIQKGQRVKFNYSFHGNSRVVKMSIPKSAKLIKITAGGEGEEHRYLYADSSMIYITSMQGTGTINEPFIVQDQAMYNQRFSSDTATMNGIGENGNYWKEVKYNNVFYGYSNVPLAKKAFFDEALSSVKVK